MKWHEKLFIKYFSNAVKYILEDRLTEFKTEINEYRGTIKSNNDNMKEISKGLKGVTSIIGSIINILSNRP